VGRYIHSPFYSLFTVDIDSIKSLNPLAIYLFEGLVETSHPYTYLVRNSIRDLLGSKNAKEKFTEVLPMLIKPLRNSMRTNIPGGMAMLQALTKVVGKNIIPSMKRILPALQGLSASLTKIHFSKSVDTEGCKRLGSIIGDGAIDGNRKGQTRDVHGLEILYTYIYIWSP
jgi:hypothetical protein